MFKAGSVYGYATDNSNIGTGNAASGYFFNGNSNLDIALTNSNGNSLEGKLFMLQSNGDGTFSLLSSQSFVGSPIVDGLSLILAGPVVNSSSADLIVTDDSSNLYLLAGNGNGTFQAPVSLGQTANTLTSYLTSQGTLNLVTTYLTFSGNTEISHVVVLLNNNDGTGTFTAQSVSLPASPSVSSAYYFDASGDQSLLIVYSDGTAGLSQFSNGSFAAPISLGTNGTKSGMQAGPAVEFLSQGNFYFAAIAPSSGGQAVYIWPIVGTGNGIGLSGSPSIYTIPTGDAAYLTTADLDGDGNPDLIVLGGGQFSTTQTINLFLSGAATSAFSPQMSQSAPDAVYGPGVYGTQVIVADANDDGKADLILYQPEQGLTVLLNQGGGVFSAPATFPAGNRPNAIAQADFNGDGTDDLAVTNGVNSSTDTSDNTVSIFVSQSPAAYASQAVFPVGAYPIAVAAGAVNGNQSVFVLSQGDAGGNLSDPVVTFLQGNGNGTFQQPVYFSTGTNTTQGAAPAAIAAGVVDSSGNATVAISNTDGTIDLFTYQNGAYAPSAQTPKLTVTAPVQGDGVKPGSLAIADVNGDGNPDLVATIRGQCGYNSEFLPVLVGGRVLIYPGNGNGTFQSPVTITSKNGNSDPGFVTTGNIFGGLLPDLLVVDEAGSGNGSCTGGISPYPLAFANGGGFQFAESDLTDPLGVGASSTAISLKAALASENFGGVNVNDIVLSANGLLSVLPNNGTGTFGAPTFYVGSSDSAGLVGGSFFGPGGHDVAMASAAGATIIEGTGAPTQAAATPIISPDGGIFTSSQPVTITDSTNNATIYYTTDGSVPSASSPVYTGSFMVGSSETVNAIAIASGFSESSVATAVFTINLPTLTTTTLTPSSSSVVSGTQVTLTATVSPAPGGNITFYDNGASIGTAVLSHAGVAVFQTSTLPVGTNVLTAIFGGSAGFTSSTSSSVTVTVTAAAPPPPAAVNISEMVTITDSPSLPDVYDAETVTVADSVFAYAAPTQLPFAAPVAYFSAGSLGFNGQSGSEDIGLSNLGQQTLVLDSVTTSSPFSVAQIACSQSATTTATTTTIPPGGSCTFSVSYSSSGNPSGDNGTLIFTDNASSSNFQSVAAGANFTQSISLSGSGTTTTPPAAPPATVTVPTIVESITVTDQVSISVLTPTSTTIVSSANPSGSGQPVTLTATVTPALNAGALTGSVIFYDGTTALSTVAISSGQAQFTTSSLSAGTHAITAAYSGNASYLASTSSVLNESISATATTTSLTSSSASVGQGQQVTLTATVSPATSGTVTFYDGATILGTATLSNGVAVFQTSSLPLGANTLTAAFAGSPGFAASTSPPITVTVASAPSQVAVPNVVGLTQASGEATIRAAGLTVGTVTTASSGTVLAGDVISEMPLAGTLVSEGSAVSLVISSGPPVVAPHEADSTVFSMYNTSGVTAGPHEADSTVFSIYNTSGVTAGPHEADSTVFSIYNTSGVTAGPHEADSTVFSVLNGSAAAVGLQKSDPKSSLERTSLTAGVLRTSPIEPVQKSTNLEIAREPADDSHRQEQGGNHVVQIYAVHRRKNWILARLAALFG